MHNRNRRVGHDWEREIAKLLRGLGYIHVVTARSESLSKDGKKVDIMNNDEAVNGKLPFNIQAKCTASGVRYYKLLSEMPKEQGIINVIFHKQTEKKEENFMMKGKYAILNLEDFLKLIKPSGDE